MGLGVCGGAMGLRENGWHTHWGCVWGGRPRGDSSFPPLSPTSLLPSPTRPYHSYVKLGQILSIRPDVLPPDVMVELARLQDKIKPFSTDEARAIIEADLGAPVDEIFSEFTAEPIAAASLAQVGEGLMESG